MGAYFIQVLLMCIMWLGKIAIHGKNDIDSKNSKGSSGKYCLFWKRKFVNQSQTTSVFSLTQEPKDVIPRHPPSLFFSYCTLGFVCPCCLNIPFKLSCSTFLIGCHLSFFLRVCAVNFVVFFSLDKHFLLLGVLSVELYCS